MSCFFSMTSLHFYSCKFLHCQHIGGIYSMPRILNVLRYLNMLRIITGQYYHLPFPDEESEAQKCKKTKNKKLAKSHRADNPYSHNCNPSLSDYEARTFSLSYAIWLHHFEDVNNKTLHVSCKKMNNVKVSLWVGFNVRWWKMKATKRFKYKFLLWAWNKKIFERKWKGRCSVPSYHHL